MIADTNFLIDLITERRSNRRGPARSLWESHQGQNIRTTIVNFGEIAVSFPSAAEAWNYFRLWRIYPLHRGIADMASDVDREMIRSGGRLGENDNWIAGFARYYREPLISRDAAFDRVKGVRRISY